jgi:tellurite resistance protein
MSNEIVKVDASQVIASWESPEVLTERIKRMVQIMTKVMIADKHYGKIPGCAQNSLFQPGSQLLSVAFKLGHEPYRIEDLSTDDEKRYRVTDRVFIQGTDVTIAYGIGECSSSEEKYMWRRAVSDEEFEATEIDRRREKFGKDYKTKQSYTTMQVRTNPSDVANTVLKMARKRANINGTIEALAASEVFTQDAEDLPEGFEFGDNKAAHAPSEKSNVQPSTAAPNSPNISSEDTGPSEDERKTRRLISSKQEGLLYKRCSISKVNPEAVKNYIAATKKVARGHFWLLSWSKPNKEAKSEFDKILETIEKKPEFFDKYIPVKTAPEAPKSEARPEPSETSAEATNEVEPTAREAFELNLGLIVEQAGLGTEAMDAGIQTMGYSALSEIPEADFVKVLNHFSEKL